MWDILYNKALQSYICIYMLAIASKTAGPILKKKCIVFQNSNFLRGLRGNAGPAASNFYNYHCLGFQHEPANERGGE